MFLITSELANAILGYLAKRPYEEVFQLVQALQRLEKQPEDKPTPKPKS